MKFKNKLFNKTTKFYISWEKTIMYCFYKLNKGTLIVFLPCYTWSIHTSSHTINASSPPSSSLIGIGVLESSFIIFQNGKHISGVVLSTIHFHHLFLCQAYQQSEETTTNVDALTNHRSWKMLKCDDAEDTTATSYFIEMW